MDLEATRCTVIADDTTRWAAVLALFFAGCTLALHQGKVPAALGPLRDEFGLTLTQVGAVVSLYAVLIASSGVLLGLTVARLGYPAFAIGGVALAGVASLGGAMSDSYAWLIVTRALEGTGWIVGVIALPVLVSAMAKPADRPLVMGLWGGFVPIGAGSMLLLAPWLQLVAGWRFSWIVAGVVSLAAALVAARVCARHPRRLSFLKRGVAPPVRSDLKSPIALLITACFFCYSFQFLAVTSFLPTLLVEREAMSLTLASTLGALVIVSNATGNLAAGRLLQRGMSVSSLLAFAAALSSVAAMLVWPDVMPAPARVLAAFAFSAISGVIPGALFATVPRVASVPGSIGMLIGLMLQGSGVGQLLGPIALPALVDASGSWAAASLLPLAAGALGIVFALALGRRLAKCSPHA